MKTERTNKKAISLIVLVITIIVMIILASSIILSLNNNGMIGKASESVSKTDLKQAETMANVAWGEAYAEGARTKEELQAKIDEKLDQQIKDKYIVIATEEGVTVTVKDIAEDENENEDIDKDENNNWVVATVDTVPIPKGFVASPYGADEAKGIQAENTKAGGLVIYELTEEEMKKGVTTLPSTETQYTSWITRNQYVWVPVDDFSKFVRGVYDGRTYSNKLGSSDYWEVILDLKTNMPDIESNKKQSSYMTVTTPNGGITNTLAEVQAMYESVKLYKGFYIARYEAGLEVKEAVAGSTDIGQRTEKGTAGSELPGIKEGTKVYSMMNKIPYNWIPWTWNDAMDQDTNGAVEVARRMYPETNANYGVVSTLTYGVQWDRTLDWWLDTKSVTSVTNSTSYGNYYDHDIASYTELNDGAKYTTSGTGAFADVTESYTKGSETTNVFHILTTGALKAARVNNIYDMAGNMYEWTMEGRNTNRRVLRGGVFNNAGDVVVPVSSYVTNASHNSSRQLRVPLLTLHKEVALVTCDANTWIVYW